MDFEKVGEFLEESVGGRVDVNREVVIRAAVIKFSDMDIVQVRNDCEWWFDEKAFERGG